MASSAYHPLTVEEVRDALRPELPASFFSRNPRRLAHLLLAFGALAAHLVVVDRFRDSADFPALYAVSLLVAGNCLSFAFFYFHEVLHGAVFAGPRIRFLTALVAGTPFLLTPTVWQKWHAHHHRHTSMPADFDRPRHPQFDDMEDPTTRVHAYLKHLHYRKPTTWVLMAFTVVFSHGYAALANLAGSNVIGLGRARTLAECAVVLVLWTAPLVALPLEVGLLGYLAPVLLANLIASAYVISNHCDSPLTGRNYPLVNARSVYLFGRGGWSHMQFGRHVEHHLFPAVTHDKLEVVTRLLRQKYPADFEECALLATIGRVLRRNEPFPALVH